MKNTSGAIAMKKKKAGLFRLLSVLGTLASVGAIVASSVTGLLAFKLYRYLDSAQKAIPTLEKAARLYIAEKEPAAQEKGRPAKTR